MTKSLDMMKCSKSICLLKNKILTRNWHICFNRLVGCDLLYSVFYMEHPLFHIDVKE